MYEEPYGTDWTSLSHDEVVERGYRKRRSEALDRSTMTELPPILRGRR